MGNDCAWFWPCEGEVSLVCPGTVVQEAARFGFNVRKDRVRRYKSYPNKE